MQDTINLPEDIAAEKAVLGAILLDKDSIKNILNILEPEDFYREAHKIIYKAMLSLFFHDEPVDIVTLANYLRSRDKLEAVGGIGYITSLNAMTSASISYHAEIVKDKAVFRKMVETGKYIQKLGYSSTGREEAVDHAQHLVMQLSNSRCRKTLHEASLTELFKTSLNRIITSNYQGISTGIQALDALTNGLRAGAVASLKAKPGTGKTALALQVMAHIASGHKVIYFTDKNIDEIALRLVCTLAGVSCWKFKTNIMEDSEWAKIQQAIAADKNNNMGLYSFNSSLIELVTRIREIYSKKKMQVIFLDLQAMLQADSGILQKIKSLAEELNIVILLLMNNFPEEKYQKYIDLSLVLKAKKRKHQLIMRKHDGGPTGSIDLSFDKELLVFRKKEKQSCDSSSA